MVDVMILFNVQLPSRASEIIKEVPQVHERSSHFLAEGSCVGLRAFEHSSLIPGCLLFAIMPSADGSGALNLVLRLRAWMLTRQIVSERLVRQEDGPLAVGRLEVKHIGLDNAPHETQGDGTLLRPKESRVTEENTTARLF